MLKWIREAIADFKRHWLVGKSTPYPGDEFREYDLLVEIGTENRFVVDESDLSGYSIAFASDYEDFQYGRGLPYYVFGVSKKTAHATYVKVGYWDRKSDMFVEPEDDGDGT